MPTPHKHAEVIKAWADGEEIEYFSVHNHWRPVAKHCAPAWFPDVQYRVKPKPLMYRAYRQKNSPGPIMCIRYSEGDCLVHEYEWVSEPFEVKRPLS